MTHIDQALHQLDHLRDMSCGARLIGGWQAAEHVVCASERTLVAHRNNPVRHIVVSGVVDDLVVDVRDVANERDVIALGHQPSTDHVEGDPAAHMSDMWRGLNGGTAQVDPDPSLCLRNELSNRPGCSVVKSQRHRRRLPE